MDVLSASVSNPNIAHSVPAMFVASLGSARPLQDPGAVEMDSFACPLAEQASGGSPALQVVDTLLWLLKRFLSAGTTGNEGCDQVLAPIFVVGAISNFTRETLAEQVEELTAEIANLPLTATQERRGRAFQKRMERARLKKMSESD